MKYLWFLEMNIDLNKLKTFIEVAKWQSISTAANRLYRTQSAVTQQISAFEQELGIALFERRNAKIFLTLEGQKLYEATQGQLQNIQEQALEIVGQTDAITGTIRIGARPDVAQSLLPDLIKQFRQRYGQVGFSISHGNAADVERMLINNEIDIGIQLVMENKRLFDVYPIAKEPLVLVASAEYLKTQKPVRKPVDVMRLDIIDYTADNEALVWWARNAAPTLIPDIKKKRALAYCDESNIALSFVRRDMGASIVPLTLVQHELDTGALVHLLPKQGHYGMSFDIAIKKKRTAVLMIDGFLQLMRESLCE
jgi:DNA-binding transcriptional LysR family regulator